MHIFEREVVLLRTSVATAYQKRPDVTSVAEAALGSGEAKAVSLSALRARDTQKRRQHRRIINTVVTSFSAAISTSPC